MPKKKSKKFIIRNIEDVKKLFARNNIKIFGIGAYPFTRSEAFPFLKDFAIVCANKTGEFTSVNQKINVFPFQTKNGHSNLYPVQNPEEILSNKDAVTYIRKNSAGKRVGIFIYKPSQKIEKLCRTNKWIVLANSFSVFDRVSGKKAGLSILRRAGYARKFKSVPLRSLKNKLPDLFQDFGKKIVVQFPQEGGGRGTFFFDQKNYAKMFSALQDKLRSSEVNNCTNSVIISSYVAGPSLSISGCITKNNGILCTSLRFQLIDIPDATKQDSFGTFCGNDWSLTGQIPASLQSKARELTRKVGIILLRKGARGLFGIDFILNRDTNELVPLEINPRLLGTAPLSSSVQLSKNEVPLEAFHLLEFFNIRYKISAAPNKQMPSAHGCHLILYNQASGSVRVDKELKGGVYTLTNASQPALKYLRPGFELGDIKNMNEFILTDGMPIKKLVYQKKKKLLRIIAKKSLVIKSGRELNSWGKTIVSQVRSNLKIHPYKR